MSTNAHPSNLAHHFDSYEQQRQSASLGMWTFLVTEIMFFGGLFTAYILYRAKFPEAFIAGSHQLDVTLGTVNTGRPDLLEPHDGHGREERAAR